ncbi:MAG TPA: DNA polymerase IV [Desulfotignum sp.]|nr:DNA polymerase IV [Desulfotignum sp.]
MILHIDMDAFFASVEQRDNPKLKNRPVVICGNSARAVVSTASYEARQFGIHSAMPLFQARQRCRHLVVVPVDMEKYVRVSRQVMAVISQFSPLMEPVSIDEAFADVTGCRTLFGPPEAIAMQIKQQILTDLSLTCSIGIAPVKFLAKIASDMHKPDGLTHIAREQMPAVLRDLPIEKVPGVGARAMKQMAVLNIRTLGDIQRFDAQFLSRKLGKFGTRLFQLSRGIDESRVQTPALRKSISSETTLAVDIADFSDAKEILLAHAGRVGRDLRKKDLVCRSVAIKVTFSDFTRITRSRKTDAPICSGEAIFHLAVSLFEQVPLKKKIRLLGVGVSHLQSADAPVQMMLIPPAGHRLTKQWESVDRAVDKIYEKFGRDMVTPAVLKPLTAKPLAKGGEMTQSMKVLISGKVQGVFFRMETRKAAEKNGVTGYVRNRADGSVEAVFQGTPDQLAQMEKWCHTGAPASRVDRVVTEDMPSAPDFSTFEIRY